MCGAVWEEGAGLNDCPQLPPEGSCNEGAGHLPLSQVANRGASRGQLVTLERNLSRVVTGQRWLFEIYGSTTLCIRSPNWMVFELRMVRIIPWDVRMISLRNTELGPVILPMRCRPKKAVRVAAQNCKSGRRCKRSWWYIICKCCGRIGALGVGWWPLPRLIPRSTVYRYQLSWDGTGRPNSWWMIRMMLRYWTTDP